MSARYDELDELVTRLATAMPMEQFITSVYDKLDADDGPPPVSSDVEVAFDRILDGMNATESSEFLRGMLFAMCLMTWHGSVGIGQITHVIMRLHRAGIDWETGRRR